MDIQRKTYLVDYNIPIKIGRNEQKSADKIEPRFDPKTLQPFDKVLVRYDSVKGQWRCTLFSHIIENEKIPYRFVTSNNAYEYCIPYNEDTKHLAGTCEEAPEYYRYWED